MLRVVASSSSSSSTISFSPSSATPKNADKELGYRVKEQTSSTGIKVERNVAVEALRNTGESDQYKKLPFLLQAELHRFLKPQGPLSFTALKSFELHKFCPTLRKTNGKSTETNQDKPLAKVKELYEYLTSVCIGEHISDHEVRPCNAEFFAGLQTLDDDGFSPDMLDRCPVLRATIDWDAQHDLPTFKLMPPAIGRSTRFHRQFGWDRWLRVAIPEEVEHKAKDHLGALCPQGEKLKQFLARPLRIANNMYRAVLYKTGTIHYFLEEGADSWDAHSNQPKRFSPLRDFFDYHIPPELNSNIAIGKYIARFTLGLSKTIPTLDFPLNRVRRVPDITSTSMYAGHEFMRVVADKLGIPYVPSCIRGKVNNMDATWRLSYLDEISESNFIEIYQDMIDVDSKGRDQIQIEFSVFYAGRMCSWTLKKKVATGHEEGWLRVLPTKWPGQGEVMTDGWATISKSAAKKISDVIGLSEVPAAFQARIGGNKGLWSVSHLENSRNEEPWIEIHDSQHKYDESAEFTFSFEVVRWSTSGSVGSLSHQIIQILAEQGVPNEIFVKLLRSSTEEKVAGLTQFRPEARSQLRKAVEVSAGLANTRNKASQTSKLLNAVASVRSYQRGEEEDADLLKATGPEGALDDLQNDVMNLYSNMPPSLGEQTVQLLDSGFLPLDNPFLAEKIKKLHDDDLAKCIGYRIPMSASTNLFVIVDPIGCLGENEVYLHLSEGFVNSKTGDRVSLVLGDVLVTRDPCVLPTDVRKVTAVYKPELAGFYDVIVFPSVGSRALCSILGGGDYDGDTIRMIWDQDIVQHFTNAPLELSEPCFAESEFFSTRKDSLKSARANFGTLQTPEQTAELHAAKTAEILLSPLFAPAHYGQLANYHTRQIYRHGASHFDSRRLAQLFAIALDAAKQSKQMDLRKFESLNKFKGPMPEWTSKMPGYDKTTDEAAVNWVKVPRDAHLGQSPMDALYEAGKSVETDLKVAFHEKFQPTTGGKKVRISADNDLTRAWRNAEKMAIDDEALRSDLELIKQTVNECKEDFRAAFQRFAATSNKASSSQRQQQRESAQRRKLFQTDIAAVGRSFALSPDHTKLLSPMLNQKDDAHLRRRLKASCLYAECSKLWRSLGFDESKWTFHAPWTLAFRDINNMKADEYEAAATRKRSHEAAFDLAGEGFRAQSIISECSRSLFTRPATRQRLS